MNKLSKSIALVVTLFLGLSATACSSSEAKDKRYGTFPKVYLSLDKYKQLDAKKYLISEQAASITTTDYSARIKGKGFDFICALGRGYSASPNPGMIDDSTIECFGYFPGYKTKQGFSIEDYGTQNNPIAEAIEYQSEDDGAYKAYIRNPKLRLFPTGYKFIISSKKIAPTNEGTEGVKPPRIVCVKPDNNTFTCKNQYQNGFIVTTKEGLKYF